MDNKILVISKYALDCQQYHTGSKNVTWETCSLRQWLNDTFLNAAFSSEEQAMIFTTTVSADANPNYDTDPGNTTEDQVFLLSVHEAYRYFDSDLARQCKPTAYAVANGASVANNTKCYWWLRTPGSDINMASFIWYNGSVHDSVGHLFNNEVTAVRPALWINLDY